MRRLMHHRKAARVLPVPVGARMRVDSPRAMAGQPSCWGRVGAGKTASNQARTGGGKRGGGVGGGKRAWDRARAGGGRRGRGDSEGMGASADFSFLNHSASF